jgi:hypothetical protein
MYGFTLALVFSRWDTVICGLRIWLYACLGGFWLGYRDMRLARMALRLARWFLVGSGCYASCAYRFTRASVFARSERAETPSFQVEAWLRSLWCGITVASGCGLVDDPDVRHFCSAHAFRVEVPPNAHA